MDRGRIAAIVLMLVLTVPRVPAQERGGGGTAAPTAVSSGARVALVIGNSAYASMPLRNPVSDATAMAEALRGCGFEVMLVADAGLRAMEEAIDAFGDRLGEGSAALFYYAGHGLQSGGQNYLVPVDAAMKAEKDARYECVDADRVLVRMESARAGVSIVILDACRSNPFERNFRAAGAGLATMNAADMNIGCLIAYSTSPGRVAEDGSGSHSLYTASLLEHLKTPGLPVEEVFKRVRAEVLEGTASAQKPWESTSLTGSFFFVPPAAAPPPTVATSPPAAPQSDAPVEIQPEQRDAAAFDTYHNARFDYEIAYPPDILVPQEESFNGDGRVFLSADGSVRLTCWGGFNVLNETLKDILESQKDREGLEVTYEKTGSDWSVVSGFIGSDVYYARAEMSGDVIIQFEMTYPQKDKARMDPVVTVISRSFKGGAG